MKLPCGPLIKKEKSVWTEILKQTKRKRAQHIDYNLRTLPAPLLPLCPGVGERRRGSL